MKQLIALAVIAALPVAALANAVVGQGAPAFSEKDLSGKTVSLADYKGKVVVLEWNNPNCPFVEKHYTKSGNLPALQKKYGQDVVWLAVNSTNPSHQDYMSNDKLSGYLKANNAAPAAYLVDADGSMGRAYGARTTPHMYVIDRDGKLLYNGAIDDKRGTNPEEIKAAKNYVVSALGELKDGKVISTPTSAPYGCSVKY
jgi:peroxiredoxin